MDMEKVEKAIYTILQEIGEDPEREGLKETPKRVARMYKEIYSGMTKSNEELIQELNKTFAETDKEGVEKFGDMVIVKDIPFYSTCEHHLVTIIGKAHIGYIPKNKVIGLSKIARLVDAIARRPQLQERIGNDTLKCMIDMLDPVGVMVVIEGRHMCMESRGVKKTGTITVTSAAYGAFKNDSATRAEFMNLLKLGGHI